MNYDIKPSETADVFARVFYFSSVIGAHAAGVRSTTASPKLSLKLPLKVPL